MEHENWTWRTENVIPSETGAGKQVLDEVLEQLKRHDWVEHDIFGVHLAVEEALVNAIRHGNDSDASKRVHVHCRISRSRVWIQIRDEGPGFDPNQVPDPTDVERLDVPSGRGLMLMRCFMTLVEFNSTGNCVTMEKHCAAGNCQSD